MRRFCWDSPQSENTSIWRSQIQHAYSAQAQRAQTLQSQTQGTQTQGSQSQNTRIQRAENPRARVARHTSAQPHMAGQPQPVSNAQQTANNQGAGNQTASNSGVARVPATRSPGHLDKYKLLKEHYAQASEVFSKPLTRAAAEAGTQYPEANGQSLEAVLMERYHQFGQQPQPSSGLSLQRTETTATRVPGSLVSVPLAQQPTDNGGELLESATLEGVDGALDSLGPLPTKNHIPGAGHGTDDAAATKLPDGLDPHAEVFANNCLPLGYDLCQMS